MPKPHKQGKLEYASVSYTRWKFTVTVAFLLSGYFNTNLFWASTEHYTLDFYELSSLDMPEKKSDICDTHSFAERGSETS